VLRHLGGDPAGDEALGELLVSERLTAEFHQPQPVEQEQRQRC
jgi:hypothetical protein